MFAALLAGLVLAVAQAAPTAQQDLWLKQMTGTWVVDGAAGSDAAITLTVAREEKFLVLRASIPGREIVTRYDLTGADVVNASLGPKSIYRTRISGQRLVTEIWEKEVAGAATSIETRYLESPNLMVTELSRTPGAPAFNRTVLKRRTPGTEERETASRR